MYEYAQISHRQRFKLLVKMNCSAFMLGELKGELVRSFVPKTQVRGVQILDQVVTVELL